MKGQIVKDWSAFDIENLDHRKMVRGALQNFLSINPNEGKGVNALNAMLQHYASTDDFPAAILDIISKYHATDDFDEGWQQVFKVIDFTGTRKSGWKILDVEDALSFRKVPIGGKAEIYKMSGTEVEVTFDKYGGGLGWDRILFDDEEYWTIEDNAIAFRNKYFADRATIFYALIDAITSGQNLTWQAVTPASYANTGENYDAIRDINTINAACFQIFNDLKDTGISIGPNSTFGILAPLQLKSRILRAMTVLNSGISAGLMGVNYNVRPPIFTGMLSSSTVYYVFLPGQKCQAGLRKDLEVFTEFDAASYSEVAVGWGRYKGVIGEVEQFQRCAVS